MTIEKRLFFHIMLYHLFHSAANHTLWQNFSGRFIWDAAVTVVQIDRLLGHAKASLAQTWLLGED